MYYSLYYLLVTYLPLTLQRPFLFSSIYPIILVPFFEYLERIRPDLFVERKKTKINKKANFKENAYHVFTFICLCLCSLFDPKTMSVSRTDPPNEPPGPYLFLIETFSLVIFYEIVLSLLHTLFHWNKWLYKTVHYVHHLDNDPTALSTTKLHIQEILSVLMFMYVIPVVCFDPHPYCLLASFMVASVISVLAHSGFKGWYLAEYHRYHHRDHRFNMLTPILSYFDYSDSAVRKFY